MLRQYQWLDFGRVRFPGGVGEQDLAACRPVCVVLVSPEVNDLIQFTQLTGEVADQVAEDGALDRKALFLIHPDVLLVLAAMAGIDALFDDHPLTPGGNFGLRVMEDQCS